MARLIITAIIIFLATPLWATTLPVGNHYFTAEWCHYCDEQEIIIKNLEKQGYNFHIYYDENSEDRKIMEKLGIKAFPHFIIVKVNENGKQSILKLKGKQPLRKLIRHLYKEDKNGKEKVDQESDQAPGRSHSESETCQNDDQSILCSTWPINDFSTTMCLSQNPKKFEEINWQQFFIIAMAVASITITIGKASIFKPLRSNIPTKWLRKLSYCPYCLSHWLSLFAVFFLIPWFNYSDLLIKTMAMVAISSIVALPILLYLNLLDKGKVNE